MSGLVRRQISAAAIGADHVEFNYLARRYFFEPFCCEPFCVDKATMTLPAAGTSLNEHVFDTGYNRFEYVFAGTVTDAFAPTLASEGGYNWLLGNALGAGVEISFGGLKDGNMRNHVPSAEDWFFRALLIFDNASGVDAFVGFRRNAAYAATLTEYSDVAGVRILGNSASTDAIFSVITNLNNAGATDYTETATTITGLEDATAVELEIKNVGGKAFFFVNGAEVAGAPAYTYGSGYVVTPVIRLLQTTDTAAQLKTLCAEGGPLIYRRPATLLSLSCATT